jgi:glycosyltransferase involved in cell wall biosynthesis
MPGASQVGFDNEADGADSTTLEGMTIVNPKLSIVIPSFQRRDSVVRLIHCLESAVDDETVEVIVVVDGSDDGTVEALIDLERRVGFPLRWHQQENSGPAAARNAGIEMARGDVFWLLDDDQLVDGKALAAHRRFHETTAQPSVLTGPTWERTSDRQFARAALRRHQRLTDAGRIVAATDFWTGNVSMPRSILQMVGGFDPGFAGAAVDDVEFGYRLMKSGVHVSYSAAAATAHDRVRAPPAAFRQQRIRGRNLVRLARLHPEALHRGPIAAPSPGVINFLFRIGVRSPRWYMALARSSVVVLRFRLLGESHLRHRVFRLGTSAARLAGLLDAGATPEVVSAFGFPKPGAANPVLKTTDVRQLAALLPRQNDRGFDAAPRMSVVVPTHQRRDKLLTLLTSLGEAIDDDSTEVVVVVDGSDDGTIEALTELEPTTDFSLRWRWQDNRGTSMARNIGVAMARGSVCWFLDDDKTVRPESLAAHRRFHEETTTPAALMGPTWQGGTDPNTELWRMKHIERLSEAGCVTDAADFRSGNTSIARSLLLEVGGFDPAFTGWGEEDVELGYRLIKHGVPITFDPAADSWHDRTRSSGDEIRQARERGRNMVRLCELHPESIERPAVAARTPRQLVMIYRRGVRSPHVYGAIASGAKFVLRQSRFVRWVDRRDILRLGKAAGRIAGLLEAGGTPDMVERFGFPE